MFGTRLPARLSFSSALRRAGIAALLMLGLAITQAPAARASAPPSQHYYLALGASFAFGYQEAKFLQEYETGTYSAGSFNTGYVDDFAQMLAAGNSQLETVNLSCPGETSDTFIGGGCYFHTGLGLSLHNDYPATTSQLDAALAFLRSHPHQVHVITISFTELSGNALSNLYFNTCHGDATCAENAFPAFLTHEQANADGILSALQAASPSSQILVLQEFNPYMLELPVGIPFFNQMNAMLATVATAHGATVADGVTGVTPSNICGYTYTCTPPLYDIHPKDAGYALLAQALWAAYDN